MIWDAQKPKGMELFGTAGIRGPVSEVTPKLTLAIGQAVSEDAMEVVVARDGRETGETLAAAQTSVEQANCRHQDLPMPRRAATAS